MAQHIFYDLRGNVVMGEYAPENVATGEAMQAAWGMLLNPHEFTLYATATKPITGDYTRLPIIEALLDPDQGMLPQAGARLVRDNYDIFVLDDEVRDFGVTIRHGKNLIGATLTVDRSGIITRIVPVGKDEDGEPLLLDDPGYVDSPRINEYPNITAKAIEYDVQVGQKDVENETQAREKLHELALADFDEGIDAPVIGLEVDFLALETTEEYAQYAPLQYVHLYDTVRVIDRGAGIDVSMRVNGYTYDALRRRYTRVTLGQSLDA